MAETSQSVQCMPCRTVWSLACFVGMSWRAEPSDSEFQTEGALTRSTLRESRFCGIEYSNIRNF